MLWPFPDWWQRPAANNTNQRKTWRMNEQSARLFSLDYPKLHAQGDPKKKTPTDTADCLGLSKMMLFGSRPCLATENEISAESAADSQQQQPIRRQRPGRHSFLVHSSQRQSLGNDHPACRFIPPSSRYSLSLKNPAPTWAGGQLHCVLELNNKLNRQ